MPMKYISTFSIALCFLISFSSADARQIVEKQVAIENIKINFRLFDLASERKEPEVSKLVAQAFSEFTKLFGGLPRDLSGAEYSEFTIHLKRGENLGGEAEIQLVEFQWSDGKVFGYADWRTGLIHEIFHLWSAESIKYRDGREHWFNEGFAEYYALKTAAQLGLISPEEAITTAAYPISYYSTSKGLGIISMRDAGHNDASKFDNFSLIYHGGWTIAMILDHEIRSQTSGKKSLDNLMAWMYKNYPRHEKLYEMKDIMIGLGKSTGVKFDKFLGKYVAGTNTVPVADYLHLSNAYWSYMTNKQDTSKYKYLYQTLGINGIEQ